MGNLSDGAEDTGDVARRLERIETRLGQLETRRTLPSASIGSGGLHVIKGGSIFIDEDGEIHVLSGRIIAGDPEGVRAEMTNIGYRLINEDGEVDIDLTVEGATNQIRLRGAGKGEEQDNEILLSNNGQINGRVLNVEEINLAGEDLQKVLDQLAAAATPTSGQPDPDPPPASGTITKRYTATWSQCYRSNGQPNNFASGLNQGFYSGTNGNQRSLIGFPSSTIQSDHSGRTITRVRLFLYFKHWYFNGGGTAVIGHHGHSNAPGSFSGTTDVTRSGSWPKPGGRWVSYSHSMQQWRTGTKKGIVLGPGPSTSKTYYGTAHRHNNSRPPRLEIRSTA